MDVGELVSRYHCESHVVCNMPCKVSLHCGTNMVKAPRDSNHTDSSGILSPFPKELLIVDKTESNSQSAFVFVQLSKYLTESNERSCTQTTFAHFGHGEY